MFYEFLTYIPNTIEPGHRGDDVVEGWGTLDHSVELARIAERHGWSGALLGTGWGRPDTFTLATMLAAKTERFRPLIAVRPGYWQPAQFASAAATLQQLSSGRVLVNVVSGVDDPGAYGDAVVDSATRYERTTEFLDLLRKLWNSEQVTYQGRHYQVRDSTVVPRLAGAPPVLYFGGASQAAQSAAARQADVQLFWGEPLAEIAERIDRLRTLSDALGRRHAPLRFGLRITTVVRDSSEQAWRAAERKVAAMAGRRAEHASGGRNQAVGQQRLQQLRAQGDVLDSCLYTVPSAYGGAGAASTWLVGSSDDVADALVDYASLGITTFILSDTPYRQEIARLGDVLLPRLRQRLGAAR